MIRRTQPSQDSRPSLRTRTHQYCESKSRARRRSQERIQSAPSRAPVLVPAAHGRLSKGALNGPIENKNPDLYCPRFDPCLARPLGDCQGFPSIEQPSIIRSIVLLFRLCGPSAIPWFIASGAIYALDSQIWCRLRPHIGKKILKRVPPSIADRDADGAISSKPRRFRVCASLDNIGPCHVLRRFRCTMRRVVLNASAALNIDVKAAARLRLARFQDRGTYDLFAPAVTPTEPSRHSGSIIGGSCRDRPSSEAKTVQVDKLRHTLRMYAQGLKVNSYARA